MELDDPFQEARWRQDDIDSFGISAIPTYEDAHHAGEELEHRQTTENVSIAQKFMGISFNRWKKYWRYHMKMLVYKRRALKKQGPIETWIPGYFSLQANKVYDFQPPEEYFSLYERAVFRSLESIEMRDWYTLPGPAEWWPEDYNFEKNGWDVDLNQQEACQKALDLFLGTEKPADYADLVFGTDEFQVVGKWSFISF